MKFFIEKLIKLFHREQTFFYQIAMLNNFLQCNEFIKLYFQTILYFSNKSGDEE